MANWLKGIQGYRNVIAGDQYMDRKKVLQFNASGDNVGDNTVLFPNAPYSITGSTLQQQITSIKNCLIALGLAKL